MAKSTWHGILVVVLCIHIEEGTFTKKVYYDIEKEKKFYIHEMHFLTISDASYSTFSLSFVFPRPYLSPMCAIDNDDIKSNKKRFIYLSFFLL